MPRNGSGSYSLPSNSWNPPVNGASATPADFAALSDDIATALTASVAADGQTPMTGNLPMGNNRVTGMADATALTDAATAGQVQNGSLTYLTGVAGANTITASLTGLAAYGTGSVFRFIAAGTNTGATTLNINALGAKNIFVCGVAATSGQIVSGQVVEVVYDGTQFHLIGGSPVNGPSFSAYPSIATSLLSTVATKVLFGSVDFNYGGGYDGATSRFTPNVRGIYSIGASVRLSTTATMFLYVYKNGSLYREIGTTAQGANQQSSGWVDVSLNGSTDYVEIYCVQSAATQDNSTTAASTWFQGHFVRGV